MKASLNSRLGYHSKQMISEFKNDLKYSAKLAFIRAGNHIGVACFKNAEFLLENRIKEISRIVQKDINDVLVKYNRNSSAGDDNSEEFIWVLWWDGLEKAPAVVQRCVRSIYENSGTHKVVFIDKFNYKNYVDVPSYILDKAANGKMGLAHLSDYIRVSLLAKYGGLWLDSTIYLSKRIPDTYFEFPVFTVNCEKDIKMKIVSQGKWATFCLGGKKNNVLFLFLKEAFEAYWKKNDRIIDYLLFDYLIASAYKTNPYVKEMIDAIPANNLHRNVLQGAMVQDCPASEFNNYIFDDTIIYKLSWRACYGEKAADGSDSVYSYFLKN